MMIISGKLSERVPRSADARDQTLVVLFQKKNLDLKFPFDQAAPKANHGHIA